MTTTTIPTNTDDVIDSRDVIEAIENYQSDASTSDVDPDDYRALLRLAEQASDYAADWEYGETLIRDSYFTEYAQQLADDIGAIDANAAWPLSHIDWEAAADELKQDYTSV